jgi:hypothetical protein
MATSKRDSEIRDYIQQSIRFAPIHLKWLTDETSRTGASINAVVRQLVDDARTYFGLPPTMVQMLEKDRAALGLDFRGYVQEVLSQRYRDLLKREFEAGPSRRK